MQKKTYLLHFLPHFLSDQDEIGCVDGAIQGEHLETIFFRKICSNKGDNCCIADCLKTLTLACVWTFTNQSDLNLV